MKEKEQRGKPDKERETHTWLQIGGVGQSRLRPLFNTFGETTMSGGGKMKERRNGEKDKERGRGISANMRVLGGTQKR